LIFVVELIQSICTASETEVFGYEFRNIYSSRCISGYSSPYNFKDGIGQEEGQIFTVWLWLRELQQKMPLMGKYASLEK
jgi:hypothetical protein